MIQDVNVEEQLKNLSALEGVDGYVIFNQDGVPLKYDKKTTHEKAVHMAALFQDLWNVTGKVLKFDLKYTGDNEVETMRLRTKHSFEFIVTQSGDFTIIVKQLCGKAIEEARLAELELAKQQAEAEEEKKKK